MTEKDRDGSIAAEILRMTPLTDYEAPNHGHAAHGPILKRRVYSSEIASACAKHGVVEACRARACVRWCFANDHSTIVVDRNVIDTPSGLLGYYYRGMASGGNPNQRGCSCPLGDEHTGGCRSQG